MQHLTSMRVMFCLFKIGGTTNIFFFILDELASGSADEEMGETCNCLPSCTSVQYDAEILKTTFDFKKDYIANKRSYNKSKGTQNYRFLDKYVMKPLENKTTI